MAKTAESCAETTEITQVAEVVDDVLRSLRIQGSLLLREPYAAPWAVAVPDSRQLSALLGQGSAVRVVAFHLVEYGHCRIRQADGTEQLLKAGEMAICFGGFAHRLYQGTDARIQPIETLLNGAPNRQRPQAGRAGGDTALLCGVFLLRQSEYNPLLDALPALLVSRLSRAGEMHNLSGVARLLADEIDRDSPGGGYVIERLLEVLCAEAIRAWLENGPAQPSGWLQGIRDPVIGQAIARIHAEPGADWSVPRLARAVAMSPSRFAARFSQRVGDSPMAYLTRWRMSVACRTLADTRKPIEQIAHEAGYESLAAFSRAFRKHLQVTPAQWRNQHRVE